MASYTAWQFKTASFRVYLEVHEEYDTDLSWDDDGSALEGLNNGTLTAFTAEVIVRHRDTGLRLGSDSLSGCIYSSVDEFVTGHRDTDPMNRNCSIMRAARGENVVICHYFPDMVRSAIHEARNTLRDLKAGYIRKDAA